MEMKPGPPKSRIYIDESGDPAYHPYEVFDEPEKRYLGLTGCFFDMSDYPAFQIEIERLKAKHFAEYPYRDHDEPLVLHRKAIINRRGAYSLLRDSAKEELFNHDLLALIRSTPFIIISVVIDKKAHLQRYKYPEHPYYYCLEAILERYCGYLDHVEARGDVMAESRGSTEDTALKKEYVRIYHVGTRYLPSEMAQRVLTSSQIKIKPKIANIAGLQLADLQAFPVKQEILLEEGRISDPGDVFGKRICEVVAPKFNRNPHTGQVEGYGKKFLRGE